MDKEYQNNNIDNIRPLNVARPKGERINTSGSLFVPSAATRKSRKQERVGENALVEDEARVIASFHEKDRYLGNSDRTGFQMARVYASDFLSLIFERDVKGVRDVPPFEDIDSPEYRIWLTQHKAVEKEVAKLRRKARREVKELGGSKKAQKEAAKKVKAPKIDYSGYACWKYNAVVFYRYGTKIIKDDEGNEKEIDNNMHKIILQEDWRDTDWLKEQDFALAAPVTYVGRTNSKENSRFLYALGFDLDGVGIEQLDNLFYQMKPQVYDDGVNLPDMKIPTPNLISNSGHGLHLYYILAAPVPLYEKNWELLNKLKTGLTNVIWNAGTSSDKKRQYQSIHQGFRLPESKTKFGEEVTCWHLTEQSLWTITGLNKWLALNKDYHLTQEEIKSLIVRPEYNPNRKTLAKAEELWPEWYARVIVQKLKGKAKWHVKRDVYDWWLRRLRDPAEPIEVHHRYWCILTLVVYAVKCDIPREEVWRDAVSVVPRMERLTVDERNHFTIKDVIDAFRAYDYSYRNWPIHTIQATTGLNIQKNPNRKGQNKFVHLANARSARDNRRKFDSSIPDWRNNDGRPVGTTVSVSNSRIAKLILNWMDEHPDVDNVRRCLDDLKVLVEAKKQGLDEEELKKQKFMGKPLRTLHVSKNSVYKWRKAIENDVRYSRKALLVTVWNHKHPDGTKEECAKDTGFSADIIERWWKEGELVLYLNGAEAEIVDMFEGPITKYDNTNIEELREVLRNLPDDYIPYTEENWERFVNPTPKPLTDPSFDGIRKAFKDRGEDFDEFIKKLQTTSTPEDII